MILVTGATGCGKSTTLASMINYRNRTAEGHIITIEDPIEYIHKHQKSLVNQREIGLDSESFDIAMRNVLRQAPDVILVGEIRERGAMENVMGYAETGHLVLSTLHSTNANQTLQRIIQFFPKEIESKIYPQIAQTLRAVVSQRLVPRADGEGMVPAVEIMLTSARIRELIAKAEIDRIKPVIESSRQDGMQTFDQSLYDLISMGIITEEVAYQAADSPGDLKLKLQGLGTGSVRIL
jgi:twitching motility protein PilU